MRAAVATLLLLACLLPAARTAAARETRTLCVPAAAESIPTSANQEDHVSMSPLAARKLAEVAGNVATVLAIEILAAARGLDLRLPLRPGRGVEAAYEYLRRHVPRRNLVLDEGLLAAAEEATGPITGLPIA